MSNRRRRASSLAGAGAIVAALGILASLIVPMVLTGPEDVKVAAAKADLMWLARALHRFRHDSGRYPSPDEGLQALTRAPKGLPGWNGPYIRIEVPRDPWGNPYRFEREGEDFVLRTLGSDGAKGGSGYRADLLRRGDDSH